ALLEVLLPRHTTNSTTAAPAMAIHAHAGNGPSFRVNTFSRRPGPAEPVSRLVLVSAATGHHACSAGRAASCGPSRAVCSAKPWWMVSVIPGHVRSGNRCGVNTGSVSSVMCARWEAKFCTGASSSVNGTGASTGPILRVPAYASTRAAPRPSPAAAYTAARLPATGVSACPATATGAERAPRPGWPPRDRACRVLALHRRRLGVGLPGCRGVVGPVEPHRAHLRGARVPLDDLLPRGDRVGVQPVRRPGPHHCRPV